MRPIISEHDNFSAVAAELESHLTQFNEAKAGPLGTRYIALTIRDDGGDSITAGLTGEIFWNALYVDLLWVDENHRHQGYGARLLRRAEECAIESSCDVVYLSTFDFQAPEFYARQGYSVIGELQNVPRGSRRQWFCKTLAKHAGDAGRPSERSGSSQTE